MDWLSFKEAIKDLLKYVIFIIIVLVLALYVVGLQQVIGSSMDPTFTDKDVVILDKLTYRFKDIKRGDVIALNNKDTKFLIKRVIGLPNEVISYKDNTLYINGESFKENYLDESVITEDFDLSVLGYQKIPEDMYLVLGDNRSISQDSRDPEVGLIPKKDVIGKVRIQIWPLNEFKVLK